MHRIGLLRAAVAAMTIGLLALPAIAQDRATVRVTRAAVVLEQPRGDSIRVASVEPGEVLEVLARQGNWYLVSAPAARTGKVAWERGWIHEGSVQLASGTLGTPPTRPAGRLMVRGFGQTGGMLLDARDSFDTLVGSPFGSVHGAGAQVVLPNGAFVQAGIDRFRKNGSRVLVSGSQIFTVDIPARITVTPLLATFGYRSPAYGRVAPYLGAGVGWHLLTEDSPSLPGADRIREGNVGYHVVGGAELPIARFLAIGGEAQWATVPKALGETGVSAVFGEDDLGGATFRFKVIVGY